MSKEKQTENEELFSILSDTMNGANFDDLNDAVYRILDKANYHKQSEGEWEEIGQGYANCSFCGTVFEALPTMYAFKRNNIYCRHCGAKMKGGDTDA